jgi:hypothetical protein
VASRHIDGSTAAIVLAGVSLVASAAAALALALPQTPYAGAVGLAGVHEARADALARTPDPDGRLRDRARTETLRTLRQAPANATAWLRLAYLDSLSPNGLGAGGNLALARSYAAAPFGPDDTVWRLGFAFNHWRALDRSNRALALAELEVVARDDPAAIRGIRTVVTDPAGWLALSLSLDTADVRRTGASRR